MVKERFETIPYSIGEYIAVYSCRYIYYGKLVEEGEHYLMLKNPYIVYDTGPHSDETFSDAQSLCVDTWSISKQSIESFGISKKRPFETK